MAWDAATIDQFIADLDGQAGAWFTAISGQPVVLPGTPIALTQQQLTAAAGATAAQQDPFATYALSTGASVFTQPGVLLGGAVLLVLVLVLVAK
jgi:hypothetical protein